MTMTTAIPTIPVSSGNEGVVRRDYARRRGKGKTENASRDIETETEIATETATETEMAISTGREIGAGEGTSGSGTMKEIGQRAGRTGISSSSAVRRIRAGRAAMLISTAIGTMISILETVIGTGTALGMIGGDSMTVLS